MNFFSNVLDSIPVVGHVKGVIHYAVGDEEGGSKAMYQATRTSAVLGGGAAGCIAGPGGAALGAMYAGLAMDGVASVVMDEPQGIVKGCKNVAEDIHKGKNPTGSILSTGFQIGMDGVGGLGMGGVSSAASQISEKAVAKTVENVTKKAVATVGEKALQKTVKVTGEEVVKRVTKVVSEKAIKKTIEIAAIQAEVALVSTHVTLQAKERAEAEEKKRDEEDRERRARERRAREERERQESEQRAREERERRAREERERQESERRAREERERAAREERERQERERRARQERERQESERRATQERERQESERRAREERERQESERRATQGRERQESERRAREERERQESERRAREERERQESERRAREERERQERAASRAREELELASSGPPAPQPPKRNKNNKSEVQAYYFALFMQILTRLLQRVFGNAQTDTRIRISQIFSNLSPGQISYLSDVIERLSNCGITEESIEIVIRIFTRLPQDIISFENFLSFLEFAAVYITDQISYRTVLFEMDEEIAIESDSSIPRTDPDVLFSTILSVLMNLPNLIETIINLLTDLQLEIESEIEDSRAIVPWFRNIYSAVYHYYKHKCVPGDGTLSVREYCDWIRLLLLKLGNKEEYTERLERQKTKNVTGTVVCDMYVSLYGRRVRIVVKFQKRKIVLSSCFVVEIIFDGDGEDGKVTVKYYPFNF